jgi:hypothetical protein
LAVLLADLRVEVLVDSWVLKTVVMTDNKLVYPSAEASASKTVVGTAEVKAAK